MNNWMKSTLGVTLAGIVVLLATYGKQLAEAFNALWLFLLAMSESAPLGLASFAVALSIATLSRYYLRKWTPTLKCPLSRDFVVDMATLLVGMTVALVQMWNGGAADRMSALWLGIGAGLAAPFLYNGLAAVFGLMARGLRAAEGEKP